MQLLIFLNLAFTTLEMNIDAFTTLHINEYWTHLCKCQFSNVYNSTIGIDIIIKKKPVTQIMPFIKSAYIKYIAKFMWLLKMKPVRMLAHSELIVNHHDDRNDMIL